MTGSGFQGLDQLLRERIEVDGAIPGAVVLVRKGEEILFHEAYGNRQRIPALRPMQRDTVFDLASLTKPVATALCTQLLWQQGGMDPDDRLERHLGPLNDAAKRGINIRHLLSHCSGLPAWRPFYQNFPEPGRGIDAEAIIGRVLEEPLEALPGEKEIYSDLGFILLGRALEAVAGSPLDRLFEDRISRPLGLVQTGYRRLGKAPEQGAPGADGNIAATELCPWRRRILVGEVHDENAYVMGGVSGHAGLFSTCADLDRIVREVFRGSRGSSELFHREGVRTFLKRQDRLPGATWALGWDTPSLQHSAAGRYFSRNSFGHNGFTGTSLWMDLDRELAVVLLTNRVHPDRGNLAIRELRPQVHDAVMEELLPPERAAR
ncbi:MAG: serine hydrolase [bacterium]